MLQVCTRIFSGNSVDQLRRVLRLYRMNNETEDAVRLEVKLFSGYYFDKMSSTSVSDVHHDSHSNHIWFVFAKVRTEVGPLTDLVR